MLEALERSLEPALAEIAPGTDDVGPDVYAHGFSVCLWCLVLRTLQSPRTRACRLMQEMAMIRAFAALIVTGSVVSRVLDGGNHRSEKASGQRIWGFSTCLTAPPVYPPWCARIASAVVPDRLTVPATGLPVAYSVDTSAEMIA